MKKVLVLMVLMLTLIAATGCGKGRVLYRGIIDTIR